MSYFCISVKLNTGDSTLSDYSIVKTLSISGLIGIGIGILLNTLYGNMWAMYTLVAFVLIVLLSSLGRTLSDTEIQWLLRLLLIGFSGYFTLLLLASTSFWLMWWAYLQTEITFLFIGLITSIVIGGFLYDKITFK